MNDPTYDLVQVDENGTIIDHMVRDDIRAIASEVVPEASGGGLIRGWLGLYTETQPGEYELVKRDPVRLVHGAGAPTSGNAVPSYGAIAYYVDSTQTPTFTVKADGTGVDVTYKGVYLYRLGPHPSGSGLGWSPVEDHTFFDGTKVIVIQGHTVLGIEREDGVKTLGTVSPGVPGAYQVALIPEELNDPNRLPVIWGYLPPTASSSPDALAGTEYVVRPIRDWEPVRVFRKQFDGTWTETSAVGQGWDGVYAMEGNLAVYIGPRKPRQFMGTYRTHTGTGAPVIAPAVPYDRWFHIYTHIRNASGAEVANPQITSSRSVYRVRANSTSASHVYNKVTWDGTTVAKVAESPQGAILTPDANGLQAPSGGASQGLGGIGTLNAMSFTSGVTPPSYATTEETDALRTRVGDLETGHADLDESVGTLTDQVNTLSGGVSAMRTDVDDVEAALGTKITADGITSIWQGTQAQYDALTPDATTLYVIREA